MAKRVRKSDSISKVERMYKIWEYLHKNTDRNHPVSQADLREKHCAVREYVGHKQTFNRLIKDMANIMNLDENGTYDDRTTWKICFDEFEKLYGKDQDYEDVSDLDDEDNTIRIKNLYYNHEFSYDEINCMIEGVLACKTINSEEAQHLIKKIEDKLTSIYYPKGPKLICKVQEPVLVDKDLLRNNLLTLQRAIDKGVQVAFHFNGYSKDKKLEPIRKEKDIVSPYYIVASGGKYYLLACRELFAEGKADYKMSIWRIDLMTNIEIPGRNERLGIEGQRVIPKRKVKNLPLQWKEDFQLKHLNMSYDNPEWITLRIKGVERRKNPNNNERADLTFLHDWFGDNFRYVRVESEVPHYDIVQVECSPYAMVNWALQYSDRVEVLDPEHVRNEVIEKVKKLNEKYSLYTNIGI